jgi:hypothetical protein
VTLLQTSFVGLIDFMAKFIIVSFMLRLAAIKLAGTSPGEGLASILF